MRYEIAHTTKYTYSDAVPVCHNIVHLQPRAVPHQVCHDYRLLVHPEPFDLRHPIDAFGNPATYFSIEQAHLGLTITAKSEISVAAPQHDTATKSWDNVAAELRASQTSTNFEAFEYAFPTPRTGLFPELCEYAMVSFASGRSVFEAAQDLTARIHHDFEYDPRATNVSTPINEVFSARRGVCQDFAHLQLACFRSVGLAARYVSGYLRTYPPSGKPRLIGADASHAWVSVFCGDAGWIDFDPTNDVIPSTDHITLAWGRDYKRRVSDSGSHPWRRFASATGFG